MTDRQSSSITFCSGVGNATGSNFLFEVGSADTRPCRVLVDCGLIQGGTYATEQNRKPFSYDPATIDFLFVTHAHADHIGRIPKLVKEGFRGPIYSTEATRAITELMFEDALKIMRREAADSGTEVMYGNDEVAAALREWRTLSYHESITLPGGVVALPKDAGHILGSAYYEFARGGRTVVFSGDLGNSPSLLLNDTEPLREATYLVIESVYGDRNHEDKSVRREKLRQALEHAISERGVLVIPAFSLERSQDILYELNHMVEDGEVPSVPVFLDSPLAIKVTDVYRRMRHEFKSPVQREIAAGDDIFKFPKLKFTISTEQSERIDLVPSPKVIIAGGGMSEGGRVIGHEQSYLPNPRNTILLVGYQAAGTLGRALLEGVKEVMIHGKRVEVHAKIMSINGYSSHKDSNHLVEFVARSESTLEKVFVAMGEPKSSLFLAQRIRDELGIEAIFPELGSTHQIEF
jgi:metallo-beta-lactamase family protein